jgi:hypothetical protein
MSFVKRKTFTQDPQILIFADGNHATNNVTVTDEFIQTGVDGTKFLPAGMFLARVNGTIRYLPRTKATTATATSSNQINAYPIAQFKPSEQLYKIVPGGTSTLIGTIAFVDAIAKKITLAANAAVALAVGDILGSQTIEEYIGLDIISRDFTDVPRMNVAAYKISTGVKQAALPYFDEEIRQKLYLLNFQTKF